MNEPDRRRSPDGFDDDAIFADIIAHLKDEASEPERPGQHIADDVSTDRWTIHQTPGEAVEPTAEGATEEMTAPPQPESQGESQPEPQPVPTPQVWRAHEVEDDDEHFEPLPVSPLPVGDLQFWAILAGMIGGPLLLVYLVFFNRNMSSYWTLTAIAMSVGGFALLVSRLPGHEDDEDDGARL